MNNWLIAQWVSLQTPPNPLPQVSIARKSFLGKVYCRFSLRGAPLLLLLSALSPTVAASFALLLCVSLIRFDSVA
ncbi:hypothetical protein MUK42_11709 [Musa troglodytarum]|uniref:Uncharacterized protein n=1 Tax=Musa troglodytarum TaxID=320322 RepID=A0A9E7HV84_9LILI|nr:hypothetical protein MUK42_11709 [Musa troglodytarum]URE41009.1 hypothetical protein MUK42_11709 [Musa troglodytarum]URE41010.1 hypothetical protein MUK42_11709 [Musa troglodytarum]